MRYLLIDRITALEPPTLARGVKCVSLSDDIFADHFPGHPVMPGALLVEAMAQLGGVLLEATARQPGRPDFHALLTMADRVRFRQLVRPGDKLELEARNLGTSEDGGRVKVEVRLDGKLAAEAELGFAFTPVDHPRILQRRQEIWNVWLTGRADEP